MSPLALVDPIPGPRNYSAATVFGLVLAGGESRRMGGGCKALRPLSGRPMIATVLERLAPQVDHLALAVGAGHDGLDELGVRCLYDAVPSFRGPLAGLQAGLQALATTEPASDGAERWLQLAPCDAPFLPDNLVARLRAATPRDVLVRVPRMLGQLQPTFAAWRSDALAAVDQALAERGGAGLLDVMHRLPHTVVDWPASSVGTAPPFFNVNDIDDLARAERWITTSSTMDPGNH
ncbi:MAG: molybdenum cofactor guanylyltransferase [Pseudomonadota bacterium]